MSFEVREQRIDLSTLGLTVVAKSDPDPNVVAHLGLKGASPTRWEDIVFLDTETTGLMGGTGTYVFLLGTAYIRDGELVLRQHLLDLGAEEAAASSARCEGSSRHSGACAPTTASASTCLSYGRGL